MPVKGQGRNNTSGPAKMMCAEIRLKSAWKHRWYRRDKREPSMPDQASPVLLPVTSEGDSCKTLYAETNENAAVWWNRTGKETRGISEMSILRRVTKEIMNIVNVSILVHAVFHVVSTLRYHRGCWRHVGSFDVIFVANEGLSMEPEGISHELGDARVR